MPGPEPKVKLEPELMPEAALMIVPGPEAIPKEFLPQLLAIRTLPLQVLPARQVNPPSCPRPQMQRNRSFPASRPNFRQFLLSVLESNRCRVHAFATCF